MADLTTAEAAELLRVSSRQVRNLIAHGDLDGRQLSDGTWVLDSASLNAHKRRSNPQGRNWTPDASWALLAELDGTTLPGLSDSTRIRIRHRIREATGDTIARRVANRVTWRTFTTTPDRAIVNALTLTGRSAAHAVDRQLAPTNAVVEGYAASEEALHALSRHYLLAPDPAGDVRIALAPRGWTFEHIAPAIVVAADLAQSPSPRDRTAGVAKINEMRATWLAKRTK